jgi:hypothetical protein
VQVFDARDEPLGRIRKRWSWVNRRYSVDSATRDEVLEIHGPWFRPWTFEIRRDGGEIGVIRKRWSGALREIFTDADFFGIQLPRELDLGLKAVLLDAVFLLDFMHFEHTGGDND